MGENNSITNYTAFNCLKTLSMYALQHNNCEGCIFYPKDYKAHQNECLFDKGCIQDYYIKFKEEFDV